MIVALATPPGESGIAIIRLSGDGVIELCDGMFLPRRRTRLTEKKGFSLTLGWLLDAHGDKIDEVLVGIMRKPNSYTGEDVVEINCHGGRVAVKKCLERCLEAGVRLAEPGEFTKRAFLNGRLDLSQAEAVIDIIRAKTEKGLKLALEQLEGQSLHFLREIEDNLIRVNAMIEASMDFPDEVGSLDYREAEELLDRVIALIEKLQAAGKRGDIYREGLKVVICGKPNVGKSSLLNLLVRKEKAIVTDIPGTTRDIIEEFINIKGIPVKIMDTAGIRETQDIVEQIGVKRSQQAMESADLVIFVLDVGSGMTDDDVKVLRQIDQGKVIVLVNKEDLLEKRIDDADIKRLFPHTKVIRGSVKEEIGLEELEEAIEEMVINRDLSDDGMEIMLNQRQQHILEKCRRHVEDLLAGMKATSLDCLGVDAYGALEFLGELSGKSLKEEVIDRIFHDFCIGK